ncbi:uncharacterized protein LOC128397641 [Panonychus citri]|uniref:uncharacterized protein LOC128397641 n=1 Tax=Panonychus citri TaxID=50023 RepID=UPI0023081C58|nr:uncharacterized protein LOC128397641 [Panonychus citri]
MADQEMRAVIRNYFLNGSTIAKCKEEMDKLYGGRSPSASSIKWWFQKFKLGRTDLSDRLKPGAAQQIDIPSLGHSVLKAIKGDRKTSLRELSGQFKVGYSTIHKVVKDHLGLKKLTTVAVPHNLSDANKEERVKCSTEMLINILSLSMPQREKSHGFKSGLRGGHMISSPSSVAKQSPIIL